jgi:hypothetical protein
MKKSIFFFFSAMALGFSAQSQTLVGVESVDYDPLLGRFIVTNGLNNSIAIVNGDGDPIGELGGASEADYGMEVMNGVIYAIAGSHVKGFNHADGTLLMDFTVSGASFLNGMASDGVNRIWVTDFSAKKIHQIDVTDMSAPVMTTIVTNTTSTPNGIVYDGANNRLVFVNWGSAASIKQVDLTNNTVSVVTTTSLSNCDGIDSDDNGNFYVSSWTPTRITRFTSNFTANEIITAPGLAAPADICYANEIDTLAIPNSNAQTVTFVGFTSSIGIEEMANKELSLSCSPNPINDNSFLQFNLKQSGFCTLEILDQTGRVVYELLNENLAAGQHKVLLTAINLSAGSYVCQLKTPTQVVSTTIIK